MIHLETQNKIKGYNTCNDGYIILIVYELERQRRI